MSSEIHMQKQHFSVVFFVFSEPVAPGSCVEVLETCQGGPKTLCRSMRVHGNRTPLDDSGQQSQQITVTKVHLNMNTNQVPLIPSRLSFCKR